MGKICVWLVADLLAIFATFRRKVWRTFVQDLDQCLFHKTVVKLHIPGFSGRPHRAVNRKMDTLGK